MKTFGLIGYPLTHSFSKKFFYEKFRREHITDCDFQLFPIDDIGSFPAIIKDIPHLCGLAVTIPYKEKIIPYLTSLTEGSRLIGAVNCIQFKENELIGHNTDVLGFEQSFAPLLSGSHNKALILGTGGAAKAAAFVLNKLNISYKYVSRTAADNSFTYNEVKEDIDILRSYNIIINTTPLGTFPNVETAPDLPYPQLNSDHILFDMVYNPAETKFLQLGKERGAKIQNGAEMLYLQAEINWQIWNDLEKIY